MSIIRSLKYIRDRLKINRMVNRLKIREAGSEDGLIYLLDEDGKFFFAPETDKKLYKYYSLLSSRTKSMIPFSHYLIACDIVIRYIGGDLKYGGPSKQMHYKVKQGDVVAEMGAFRGFYTLMLANQIGSNGKIIAIEAMPDNYKYLEKNIQKNRLENVVCIQKGVWNEKDKKSFGRKPKDLQSSSIQLEYGQAEIVVEVDSLMNILEANNINDVGFMVIQLNGAEFNAIQGLGRYLPKHLSIAARYNFDNENSVDKIIKLLQTKNYTSTLVENEFIFARLNN